MEFCVKRCIWKHIITRGSNFIDENIKKLRKLSLFANYLKTSL